MAKSKPIELMHLYFGVKGGMDCCGTCCNLVVINAGNKKFRKCKAYGTTCSSKSDFAKRWEACGLYGKEVHGQIVSDTAKRIFSRCGIAKDEAGELETQIDGQVGIFSEEIEMLKSGE